jgi:NTE family protein
LLRRITGLEDDEPDDDVPTQVETLLLLGNVPLLAGLSTRQLAELAEAAHWEDVELGATVVAAGEVVDALLVVSEGELRIDDPSGPRTIGAGHALDDLAVVAPAPAPAAVIAAAPTRLLRLSRVDFEELVDDVPGLAAAVCRVLGQRARR